MRLRYRVLCDDLCEICQAGVASLHPAAKACVVGSVDSLVNTAVVSCDTRTLA